MSNSLFGAYQGQHLCVRLQGDPKALLIPVGDGSATFGESIGFRVAVIGRHLGRLPQSLHDVGGGGNIGVANAKGYYVRSLSPLAGDGLAYPNEKVGREFLYSVGEFHKSVLGLSELGHKIWQRSIGGSRLPDH